ncbi:NAD(P)H-dependent oxidoreductase [Pseudomonas japonica]|uniref:NAD(P)H dehydrogenase (Quinone) n=1 Tax=Pseudomonas japonica TaxID=256466 RepID=A0A239KKQ6_9PSED|nr:NAD(P)H-dependent oxidoreductase [Pseudomonas japonica]SNT17764.1 NAD(P)H dehydrogenase (quinone) [Pseudomonas japonica]
MNVLIVYAHPEPRSLNGALKDHALAHLQRQGHAVQVSDLYAMGFNPLIDVGDNRASQPGVRFRVAEDSRQAYADGTQSPDIALEQDKLRWADAVILQFPLWWFGLPAILKGWVDRVYACGFAYGVGEHSDRHWGDRYGEGNMSGKRAMLMVSTGGWASHYAPRGVNGSLDAILFPIQHGILFYPGFEVLPPFVLHRTSRIDAEAFAQACTALEQRLDGLWSDAPIAWRRQNDGDYLIPELTLRPELAPGVQGLDIHLRDA